MSEQPTNPQFDIILAECLDAILYEKVNIRECIQRYPEYADDLLPELQLAALTSRLKSPKMPETSVDKLEAKLLNQFDAMMPETKVIRPNFWQSFSRVAAAIFIVTLLLIGSGGGAVYAAADDMPGDPLYGVKRFWENVIVAIASVAGQLDDVWLQLAQTRFDELLHLNLNGTVDADILADFMNSVELAVINADVETTPALISFLQDSRAKIETDFADFAVNNRDDYNQLLHALTPQLDAEGKLMIINYDPALYEPTSTPTITPTLTATASITPTQMPSFTPTDTPSITPTVNTATPTPSRTPTPTITLTPVPSLTLTVTASWTPIDFPDGPPTLTPAPPSPVPANQVEPTDTPAPIANSTVDWLFYRATERSVYLTQTQIAADEE